MDMVKLGRKFDGADSVLAPEYENFPSLYFDGDKIDELGLKGKSVGDEMIMISKIRVSGSSEYKGGEKSISVELIEAKIKPLGDDKDASSVLFPNG